MLNSASLPLCPISWFQMISECKRNGLASRTHIMHWETAGNEICRGFGDQILIHCAVKLSEAVSFTSAIALDASHAVKKLPLFGS